MRADPGVLVVGAGMAGLATVEGLRAEGFDGPVTLVGAEPHPPYSRPALSKQFLSGAWDSSRVLLSDAERLGALRVETRLGLRAEELDVGGRRVRLGPAWRRYSSLVIATGLVPRRLAGPSGAPIPALRSLDDAAELVARLGDTAHVTVIGSGILGCEIASTLTSRGLPVTLVGRGPRIAFGALGELLGDRVERLLREGGVHVRLGPSWADAAPRDDGLVIAAIGSVPAVGWLVGSGLDLSDGVRVDASGCAAPGVYAVGDVACRRDPVTGIASRVEHQTGALADGQAVARVIAGASPLPPDPPFFWSEVLGTRIQALGTFPAGSTLDVVDGDLAGDRFVVRVRHDGRQTGLIGWNSPREFRTARTAFRFQELC